MTPENEFSKSGSDLYICGECGLAYADRERADECETWCRTHKTSNPEITKYAVHR